MDIKTYAKLTKKPGIEYDNLEYHYEDLILYCKDKEVARLDLTKIGKAYLKGNKKYKPIKNFMGEKPI